MATSLYTPAYQALYPSSAVYQYYGQVTRYYLDYLDLAAGTTLVAVPGGSYAMAPASGYPWAYSVPPADGEWAASMMMAVLRPASRIVAVDSRPLIRAAGAGPCGLAIVSGAEEVLRAGHPQVPLLPRAAEVPIPRSPVPYEKPVRLAAGAGPCGLAVT